MAMRSGLVHQPLALQDTKAVLLVDGHEAETRERDVVFDQRMRANDQLGSTAANALESRLLFGERQAADEQFHPIACFAENPPRGKEMLDRQNFRRRHERGLRAVLDEI